MTSELEQKLRSRVAKMKTRLASRQKSNYNLAKQLGFTVPEATVLQNWREEDIKELARQRGYISSPPPLPQAQEVETEE